MYFPNQQPSNYAIFFFNDTATTEIYTLSLHDALPILGLLDERRDGAKRLYTVRKEAFAELKAFLDVFWDNNRSEEHTSELQSPDHLVCRLLLEKKKSKTVLKQIYLFGVCSGSVALATA